MNESMVINLSPLQVLLSLAFQIWIIVFPILILRKLNSLIQLLHAQYDVDQEAS